MPQDHTGTKGKCCQCILPQNWLNSYKLIERIIQSGLPCSNVSASMLFTMVPMQVVQKTTAGWKDKFPTWGRLIKNSSICWVQWVGLNRLRYFDMKRAEAQSSRTSGTCLPTWQSTVSELSFVWPVRPANPVWSVSSWDFFIMVNGLWQLAHALNLIKILAQLGWISIS